jgi:hypothetical protein
MTPVAISGRKMTAGASFVTIRDPTAILVVILVHSYYRVILDYRSMDLNWLFLGDAALNINKTNLIF